MDLDMSVAKQLHEAIGGTVNVPSMGQAMKMEARVTSVSDGIWVSIEGGADRTPVKSTTAEVAVGDTVTVEIIDGGCIITGNVSKAATSQQAVDSTVAPVRKAAAKAQEDAKDAAKTATSFADFGKTHEDGLTLGFRDANGNLVGGAAVLYSLFLEFLAESGVSLAKFGTDGARVGAEDGMHSVFDSEGFRVVDGVLPIVAVTVDEDGNPRLDGNFGSAVGMTVAAAIGTLTLEGSSIILRPTKGMVTSEAQVSAPSFALGQGKPIGHRGAWYAPTSSGANGQCWLYCGDWKIGLLTKAITPSGDAAPYKGTYTWKFAEAFGEAPYVFTSVNSTAAVNICRSTVSDISTTSCGINLFRSSTASTRVYALAIGPA